MDMQEKVNTVSSLVNSMCFDSKEFARLFTCQHRTLQQNLTRLCVAWLKELSNMEYFDDRNKASVEFAKSIKEQLDNVALPMI